MDERFRRYVETVVERHGALMAMEPVALGTLPKQMPTSAVYMMSEGQSHLYVGRTRRLRSRLREHSGPALDAPFAFRLTREAVGKPRASYRPDGSRSALLRDPLFREVLTAAKVRIKLMDIRFVEEGEPMCQAMLEMYTALVTGAPYNDFKTT